MASPDGELWLFMKVNHSTGAKQQGLGVHLIPPSFPPLTTYLSAAPSTNLLMVQKPESAAAKGPCLYGFPCFEKSFFGSQNGPFSPSLRLQLNVTSLERSSRLPSPSSPATTSSPSHILSFYSLLHMTHLKFILDMHRLPPYPASLPFRAA